MSDFSLFSLFTAGLACLVPFTSAYTQPVGDAPEGNPLYTPGLHDVVPVGQPYTITWQPTTEGTVTLVLLKGPSNNAQPQYAIVEGTMNTGSYVWVPSDDLEPGSSGYGIQLICDSNGQYQYTTQFGISNDDYAGSYGSSSSAVASASSYASIPATGSALTFWDSSSSGYAVPTSVYPHYNGTAHPTGGWGHHNATQPNPTGHHTTKAPATHTTSYAPAPTVAKPSPATASGGASNVEASLFGFVAAAGIAVFAL